MSDLNCRLSQEQITQKFEVGSVLNFKCESLKPDGNLQQFDWTKAQFVLNPETQYQIRLLKAQSNNSQEVELQITGYVPGDYKWPDLKISDQKSSLLLNEISFQIQSVLDPQNPEKEPFGPMGPMSLSFPTQFAMAVGLGVLVIVILLGLKIRRALQKRNLVRQITKDSIVQKPLAEFSAVIRKLKKDYSFFDSKEANELELTQCFEKIDAAYRRFLVRRLMVPAHVWNDSQILKDIRKSFKTIAKSNLSDLKSVLTELGRFKKNKNRTASDLIQLIDMCQKSSEKLDLHFQNIESQKERSQ